MSGFTATMEDGLDAARRLVRRLQVHNRTVQLWTAEALLQADAAVQERIDRGAFTAEREDAPCETEEGS